MSDADILDDVIARLWTVRERLGSDVYRAAGQAALNAIGAAVMEEAERRASAAPRPGPWCVCPSVAPRREPRKNRHEESRKAVRSSAGVGTGDGRREPFPANTCEEPNPAERFAAPPRAARPREYLWKPTFANGERPCHVSRSGRETGSRSGPIPALGRRMS
jgi:hypothetical protein